VRKVAPRRELIVLTDLPLRRRLEPRARELGVRLLETYGRPYSPWPRDPFSLARTAAGGVQVLIRPNLQPGREEDASLGPELVQNLPDDLDRAWGRPTWAVAPVPFHNGQVLMANGAAWTTLHALEPRILALLGVDRVPVETFGTAAGIDRYLQAARKAAAELSALYGRPVRLVHPLPERGELAARMEAMRRIGGGAGYDLDSILTLLPARDTKKTSKPFALVADVTAGRELLSRLGPNDWQALQAGYGLEPSDASLVAAQSAPGALALDGFLDDIAAHLAKEGWQVRRLPLVSVPVPLLRNREGLEHAEFLLTWNNVVAEVRDGRLRAEGFSSLIPAGDEQARRTFAEAGADLSLVPPLVRSVILNGGYRCASNHLRAR